MHIVCTNTSVPALPEPSLSVVQFTLNRLLVIPLIPQFSKASGGCFGKKLVRVYRRGIGRLTYAPSQLPGGSSLANCSFWWNKRFICNLHAQVHSVNKMNGQDLINSHAFAEVQTSLLLRELQYHEQSIYEFIGHGYKEGNTKQRHMI